MESPWIDIGAELVLLASEGLSLNEWLSSWATLDDVSSFLVCITTMPLDYHEYPLGDDLGDSETRGRTGAAAENTGTKVDPSGTSTYPASPTSNVGAEGVAAAHAGCGAAGMHKIH